MRRLLVVFGVIVALAIPTVALAATIDNLSGQSCGSTVGTWHFVNNQTGGASAGTPTATFTDPISTSTVGPSKVLGSTQHFYVTSAGTLASAVTNLPGKLVLSDFSCVPPKDGGK